MLFGLAIEKSNIEAHLMQIELQIEFLAQKLILSGRKSETGATTCQTQIGNRGDMFRIYIKRISTAFRTILGGGRCGESYY